MRICYSGKSAPSARRLAEQADDITIIRANDGDVNWGRARANTSLNPDISTVTNKRVMRQLFKEHDVPMPRLVENSFTVGQPIVGRPDRHSGGRGFWLCYTNADVHRALRGTRRKRAATHFMEYIDAPREYRVHIFKNKSIRISQKAFGLTGETAHGRYTTMRPNPEHNVSHVREAAKKAVQAVGLDFGAVDVLADDENCWVLEVNAAPGIGGSMPRVYTEAFRDYLSGQSNQGE